MRLLKGRLTEPPLRCFGSDGVLSRIWPVSLSTRCVHSPPQVAISRCGSHGAAPVHITRAGLPRRAQASVGDQTASASHPLPPASGGSAHFCALRENGAVACWGQDESDQSSPPENERLVSIDCGGYHACGLRADGTVVCWGADSFGHDIFTSLARPSLPGRRQPVQVPRLRFRVRRPIAAW